jgi:hypothetical protein
MGEAITRPRGIGRACAELLKNSVKRKFAFLEFTFYALGDIGL